MNYAIMTAVIAAGVSLAIAILAAIIQTRNNYLQAVTAERSKWIDKLRMNIAALSGMIRTLSYKNLTGTISFNSQEYISSLDEINKVVALIRLQLNPDGTVDQNILSLLDRLPYLSESAQRHPLLRRGDDLLIAHSQWLLKDEWEKVKREADIFGRFRAREEIEYRDAKYVDFSRRNDIAAFLKSR